MEGSILFENQSPAAVAPSRMFNACVLDCHNLYPKVVPQAIKSVEILHGDGGVGTVKLYKFGDGLDGTQMKQRIDELDTENCRVKYTIYERDGSWGVFDKVVYDTQFEAWGDGGCLSKVTATSYVKPGQEVKEELVKDIQKKGAGLYKVLEAHLIANPSVYP